VKDDNEKTLSRQIKSCPIIRQVSFSLPEEAKANRKSKRDPNQISCVKYTIQKITTLEASAVSKEFFIGNRFNMAVLVRNGVKRKGIRSSKPNVPLKKIKLNKDIKKKLIKPDSHDIKIPSLLQTKKISKKRGIPMITPTQKNNEVEICRLYRTVTNPLDTNINEDFVEHYNDLRPFPIITSLPNDDMLKEGEALLLQLKRQSLKFSDSKNSSSTSHSSARREHDSVSDQSTSPNNGSNLAGAKRKAEDSTTKKTQPLSEVKPRKSVGRLALASPNSISIIKALSLLSGEEFLTPSPHHLADTKQRGSSTVKSTSEREYSPATDHQNQSYSITSQSHDHRHAALFQFSPSIAKTPLGKLGLSSREILEDLTNSNKKDVKRPNFSSKKIPGIAFIENDENCEPNKIQLSDCHRVSTASDS
jgi:hypothetical protein